MKAQLLADYILLNYNPMSHLKLQKLLFYCEAYHLAYFNSSLIDEEFEAWVHGPVCREVFDIYKSKAVLYKDLVFEGDKGDVLKQIDALGLSSDQVDLLNDVLNTLNSWSAFELESATHREYPWIQARAGVPAGDKCANKISKETMRDFYKSELVS
ncbi:MULTISPECIES: Panacea domain-containing protein [Sphingobacterium]|uniref:Panacea domain-containing protein n=1 Tax=Sphingobacterium TaxID=28453 RepID=UPI000EC549C4|nr:MULTISPECIES: type II toxin-antitoxin system antitoxin SocA domain-containing protein [Sphingobacterium]HAF36720.1 hypothetical protein [Sphingobacterium sp.]HAL53176.1 hypothetical protein [Sphingobacterium sp.]